MAVAGDLPAIASPQPRPTCVPKSFVRNQLHVHQRAHRLNKRGVIIRENPEVELVKREPRFRRRPPSST
jgi:hypothetical protein